MSVPIYPLVCTYSGLHNNSLASSSITSFILSRLLPLHVSFIFPLLFPPLSSPPTLASPPVLPFACPTENPCPEQGDIIQIKLSEHTEVLPKADGTGSTTMLVDTVFEMNYSTGQWTRLKKYKPITNVS